MSAPRIPPAKDSLAAVASHPAITFVDPVVNQPEAALEEAISRLIDAECTLALIGSAVFEMAADDRGAGEVFSATEVLRREIVTIGGLLDGIFRAISTREAGE